MAALLGKQGITHHSISMHLGIQTWLKVKPSLGMRKIGDLNYFECVMVPGARRTGPSISETSDPLEFSHTTISRGWSEKGKYPVS